MPDGFAALPPEAKWEIVGHLIDENIHVGMMNDLNNIRQVDASLRNIVGKIFKHESLTEIVSTLVKNFEVLNNMPVSRRVSDRQSLMLHYYAVEADFVPLKSPAGRSAFVDSVLTHEPYPPEDAVSKLISNIEYLKPSERSRILDHALSNSLRLENFEHLLRELIKRAEHLSAEDRSRLMHESCRLPPESKLDVLEFWGDKMLPLNEKDQSKILAAFYSSDFEVARSLAYFAENIDKLLPTNRSELTRRILELPIEHQGKWQAVANLCEHLDSLVDTDPKAVASYVVENYAAPLSEAFDPTSDPLPWYTEEHFCRVEALHCLANHHNLLDQQHLNQVRAHLEEITNQPDAPISSDQAQLITHLSAEQRKNFVRTALQQSDDIDLEYNIGKALTARMKELSDEEREIYLSNFIPPNTIGYENSKELLEYNICNNIQYFSEDHRRHLVENQIMVMRNFEAPSYAGNAVADLARIARYLSGEDITSLVNEVSEFIHGFTPRRLAADDHEGISIRSCRGHAVRCLSNWAGAAISVARPTLQEFVVSDAALPNHNLGNYTDGQSEPTDRISLHEPGEYHSEQGSLYDEVSVTDASDDESDGYSVGQRSRSASFGDISSTSTTDTSASHSGSEERRVRASTVEDEPEVLEIDSDLTSISPGNESTASPPYSNVPRDWDYTAGLTHDDGGNDASTTRSRSEQARGSAWTHGDEDEPAVLERESGPSPISLGNESTASPPYLRHDDVLGSSIRAPILIDDDDDNTTLCGNQAQNHASAPELPSRSFSPNTGAGPSNQAPPDRKRGREEVDTRDADGPPKRRQLDDRSRESSRGL